MVIGKKLDRSILVASAFSVNTLLVFISFLNFQNLVSASCIFTDGRIGECVKFENCHSAVILSRKGVNPGFCNLEEGTVCCLDYRTAPQVERRPLSEPQPSPSRKRSFQASSPEASNVNKQDTFENDPNFQRKKHSVGADNNGSSYGKKKANADFVEEPYKFETPNGFWSDSVVTNKPVRRPSRPKNDESEDYFVPPGLAKKKPWRDEKTAENEYYYEQVTKKSGRGQNRKGSNKHIGNSNEKNNSQKWGDISTSRTPEWSDQGGRKSTNDWYNVESEFENDYSKQRTTPKRNKWEQETYTTTRRPNYFDYSSVKPNRQPQTSPSSNFSPNYPNYQGPTNQENKRPIYEQGSHFEENRPTYQQVTNFGGSRPSYQQGSNIEGDRPKPRPGLPKRRISELKCEEYSKEITENITGLPLTTNPDPVTIPVRKCITPQQLIVGGENTTLGEFPHMAAIGFRDRNKKQIAWNCGGSLISEQFVMTAAHCTSTSSGRPIKVRLGEYNLMKNDDGAYPVDYAIVEIVTHPEYRPPSKYNDIALLKLSRKVTFFKHIRPACLYLEETFSSSKAIATGWGRMYYDGGTSEILQKVVLNIVDNFTCNRLYKVNVKTEVLSQGIVNSQLCAGELTGGKDTCQGDSGGPLSITSTKCIHHIIGITSFGKSCALPNSTGVYTRVSAYVPWIESVVWPIS